MRYLFAVIILVAGLVSCTPMKLGLSEDLRQHHDEFKVNGRQGVLIKQRLSFGEFATTKVKRSWTKGDRFRAGLSVGGNPYADDYQNIIGVEYINKKQTLHFSLTDGRRHSEVFCVSKFHSEDLQLGRNPNSLFNILLDVSGKAGSSQSHFYVQLYTSTTERPWELLLNNQAAQAKAKTYTGVLAKSKDEYYTIVPVTQLESKGRLRSMPFGSAGFELHNAEGKPVAAVSMMDKGVVYMGKSTAEERFLLANLCAALLLQQQIGG